jgi:hypothetical protein
MKQFATYLTEGKKDYGFRIKLAIEPTDGVMDKLEHVLSRYELISISHPKKSPIQKHPADFQTLKNAEVWTIDAVVNYPATPDMIWNNMEAFGGIPRSMSVVMNADNYDEIAREEAPEGEQVYVPLVGSEMETTTQDPTFGDEYNKKMLGDIETREYELAVPNGDKAKFSSDAPEGKQSVVGTHVPDPSRWPWNAQKAPNRKK